MSNRDNEQGVANGDNEKGNDLWGQRKRGWLTVTEKQGMTNAGRELGNGQWGQCKWE